MVNSLGVGIAQAIESEVFDMRMDVDAEAETDIGPSAQLQGEAAAVSQPASGQVLALSSTVDQTRLRQLTAASMILLATWETRTYLRRLYGMGTNRHDQKAKEKAKDLNRSPVKVQGIHGDKLWDEMAVHMLGLKTPEMMLQKCKAFVELLNVDKEFQVADEEDDLDAEEPGTPSEGDEGDFDGMGDRGRKRKGGSTPGGRKKRARSGSQARKRGRPRKNPTDPESDVDADGDWI
jgi:cohesin loading factor subunit SCC2